MKYQSKYSKETNSSIRYSIIGALQDLATFNGIDINTMRNTAPYSIELSKVTSQKIAAELKKLIDLGMVVKEVARGKTVKYMLRSNYTSLVEEGEVKAGKFGYGDYRDEKPSPVIEEFTEEEERLLCERIDGAQCRVKYAPMW